MAANDAKAKAVEDRKFVIAACKAKAVGEKKKRLISSTEAKAAKAESKVDKLGTKLAEATKGVAVTTLPGCGTAPTVLISPHSYSHKKCKGITGSPSSVHPLAVCSQLSPQQMMVMANKRVSVQSPLWSLLYSPEDLSSSESSSSSSGDDDEMLAGEDINDEIKTPFVLPAKCRDPLPHGTCSEACGGSSYGALQSADRPVTIQARALQGCKFDKSLLSSNGSLTDDVSNTKGDANEITFSDKDGDKGHTTHTPVRPTTLFNDNRIPVSRLMERDEVSILDGIWLGSHEITLLTHFVAFHFAGD
jgi:hypothetical protein